MTARPDDPIERIIASALDDMGISYVAEAQDKQATACLDFRIGDVYIECKAFHTPRIADQMARVDNVIAVQGRSAAELLARLIRSSR